MNKTTVWPLVAVCFFTLILALSLWPASDKNPKPSGASIATSQTMKQTGAAQDQNPTVTARVPVAPTVSPVAVDLPTFQSKASIQAGDKSYQMQSSPVGGAISSFAPVSLSPKQRVHVAMGYPGGEANQLVLLESEDGGLIDGKVPAKVVRLDAAGGLAFDFKAGSDAGPNRIVLSSGNNQTVLHFNVESDSAN
jgi:hypothetical protein